MIPVHQWSHNPSFVAVTEIFIGFIIYIINIIVIIAIIMIIVIIIIRIGIVVVFMIINNFTYN